MFKPFASPARPRPTRQQKRIFRSKLLEYVEVEKKYREASEWANASYSSIGSGFVVAGKKNISIVSGDSQGIALKIHESGKEQKELAREKKRISGELIQLEKEFFGDVSNQSPTLGGFLRSNWMTITYGALLMIGKPVTALVVGMLSLTAAAALEFKNAIKKAAIPPGIIFYWKSEVMGDRWLKKTLGGAIWKDQKIKIGFNADDKEVCANLRNEIWANAISEMDKTRSHRTSILFAAWAAVQLPIVLSMPVAGGIAIWISRVGGGLKLLSKAIGLGTSIARIRSRENTNSD